MSILRFQGDVPNYFLCCGTTGRRGEGKIPQVARRALALLSSPLARSPPSAYPLCRAQPRQEEACESQQFAAIISSAEQSASRSRCLRRESSSAPGRGCHCFPPAVMAPCRRSAGSLSPEGLPAARVVSDTRRGLVSPPLAGTAGRQRSELPPLCLRLLATCA